MSLLEALRLRRRRRLTDAPIITKNISDKDIEMPSPVTKPTMLLRMSRSISQLRGSDAESHSSRGTTDDVKVTPEDFLRPMTAVSSLPSPQASPASMHTKHSSLPLHLEDTNGASADDERPQTQPKSAHQLRSSAAPDRLMQRLTFLAAQQEEDEMLSPPGPSPVRRRRSENDHSIVAKLQRAHNGDGEEEDIIRSFRLDGIEEGSSNSQSPVLVGSPFLRPRMRVISMKVSSKKPVVKAAQRSHGLTSAVPLLTVETQPESFANRRRRSSAPRPRTADPRLGSVKSLNTYHSGSGGVADASFHRYFLQKLSFSPNETKVLLVDHDSESRQKVLDMLCQAGYEVDATGDANQAWKRLRATADVKVLTTKRSSSKDLKMVLPVKAISTTNGVNSSESATKERDAFLEYHIVISDVKPNIGGDLNDNGATLLRRIRDDPFLMMVAGDEMDAVYECLRAGADDFILKPVGIDAVKNVWRSVWRKRKEKKVALLLDEERRRREELEATIDALQQTRISNGAEAPINAVVDTVDSILTNESNLSLHAKEALRSVLETLKSSNLYRPDFNHLFAEKILDPESEHWLSHELLRNEASMDRPHSTHTERTSGRSSKTDSDMKEPISRALLSIYSPAGLSVPHFHQSNSILRAGSNTNRPLPRSRLSSFSTSADIEPVSPISTQHVASTPLSPVSEVHRISSSINTSQKLPYAGSEQSEFPGVPSSGHFERKERPPPISIPNIVIRNRPQRSESNLSIHSIGSPSLPPLTPFLMTAGFVQDGSHPGHVFADFKSDSTRLELLQHWSFDVWSYASSELIAFFMEMIYDLGIPQHFAIPTSRLQRFFRHVGNRYKANPYHNFQHCFDVTHAGYLFLKSVVPRSESSTISEGLQEAHSRPSTSVLSKTEQYAFFLSCVCHDLLHDGRSNNFHIATESELALIYNDKSVLENYHSHQAFRLFREHPEADVVGLLPREDRKEIRNLMVRLILATDMSRHVEVLGAFNRAIALNWSWSEKSNRELAMEMLMKCSDISNSLRPMHLAKSWSDLIQEEMFAQGDAEKALGLNVSAFGDRDNPQQARLGVTFADFMVLPLFRAAIQIFPAMTEHLQSILLVRDYWQKQLSGDDDDSEGGYLSDAEDAEGSTHYSSCQSQEGDQDEWSHHRRQHEEVG